MKKITKILVINSKKMKLKKSNVFKRFLYFISLENYGSKYERFGGEVGFLKDFSIGEDGNLKIVVEKSLN